jgi:hypothetical protein
MRELNMHVRSTGRENARQIPALTLPEKRKIGGSAPPLTTIIATLALDADLRKGRQRSSAAEIPG